MKLLPAMVLCVCAWAAAAEVPFPTGYRAWRHVKSMVIDKGHPLYDSFGGIHHIYANAKALEGYRTGRWPDGAVLIFDLLEAKAEGGAIVEGQRKVLGVMHRDSKRFAETGGWGYEGFKGGNPSERAVGTQALKACHSCHMAQKDKSFVYSSLRE